MKWFIVLVLLTLLAFLHTLDPVRQTIQGYENFLPGNSRERIANCWIVPTPLSYDAFDGFYCIIPANPRIIVSGEHGKITSTIFVFENVRLGDVLAVMGSPSRFQRTSLGIEIYWGRTMTRVKSLDIYVQVRFLSFIA